MKIIRNLALRTAAVLAIASASLGAQSYNVTNLVSDGSVPAVTTDANFKNPWAISTSGTFWISTANTGYNYVIPPAGTISFKVIVPTATAPNTAPGLPAGAVTTGGAVGMLLANGTKASFLFSTLDGTISGWNSKLGTANALSTISINNSAAGASYPGMAILNIATNGVTSSSYILAANFGTGNGIEVYDSTFAATKLAGGTFTDPTLPSGYSPFSVHVLGTQVFVAYAQRTTAAPYRTVDGVGNGIVDVYDNTGKFVSRVAANGTLNSPWGVAFAPANFGVFSNDLLIGNFGDGLINVFDPKTFAYLGQLIDSTGKPLQYASLWELLTGGTTVTGTTGVSGGDTSSVYFTAGLTGETHGLLGVIANGKVTGATPTFGFSTGTPTTSVIAGLAATATVNLVPVNGFSGNVTLTCSGLPTGAACVFLTPQVSVSATVPTQATVTINTTKATAALTPLERNLRGAIVAAFLLPFTAFAGLRKKHARVALRLMSMGALLVASAMVAGGCASGSSTPATPVTPAGTSNVTVTATSGTISQTTTVALTVK